MRTRDKILILLLTVTLALGAFILLYSGENQDAVLRFRWLVFNHPLHILSDALESQGISGQGNSTIVWYGWMSLFALTMIGFVIRWATDAEVQAFKERLVRMQVEKSELETILEDTIWKEKHAREAKEAAVKGLETNASRSLAIQRQLSENEILLKNRDGELRALQSQVNAMKERPGGIALAGIQKQSALQDELREKTDLLQAKDSAIKQLEKNLIGKVQPLESQLSLKDKLLNERDKELEALKGQLAREEAAKAQTESSLADELRKEKRALQAKDSAMKELEKSLTAKLQALEAQMREKQGLLQSRSTELDALRSKVTILSGQLTDLISTRERAETGLQQELKRTAEVLRAKDSAMKELKGSLIAKFQALESQMHEKQELLQSRSTELEALTSEVATLSGRLSVLGSAKEQAEHALQRQLKKQTELIREKDSVIKELQEGLSTVHALEGRLVDKETLLKDRDAEIEALRSKVSTLAAVGSAKKQTENALQQELRKQMEALRAKDAAVKQLEESLSARVHALEGELNDKAKVLAARNAALEALRAEMESLAETRSVRERTESSLADELKKEKQALQAKDAAMKGLEKSLTAKVHALEAQMHEKQELLQSRSTELEALTSEVTNLSGRLTDLASTKERAENLLQQELKKKMEVLQSKDIAIQELETNLSGRVHALENQLSEKDGFIKDRDAELDVLKAQLTKMGSANEEIEDLLREERRKAMQVLEAKDSTVGELEKSLNKAVNALENRSAEQETLLKGRAAEIQGLKSELDAVRTQLTKVGSVTERSGGLIQQKLLKESSSRLKELDENLEKVQSLESVIKEKEDMLKIRDGKIERLESELKEKRTELARHEITVWQGIERRAAWKQRLKKFGIDMKD